MSLSSRKLWTDKLLGKKLKTTNCLINTAQNLLGKKVLGIDPSLRGTGLAILEKEAKNKIILHFSKTIKIPKSFTEYECLGKIFSTILEIINSYNIAEVAFEKTIFVQNPKIAQIMGAAKGAAIAAISTKTLPITEYAPLRIKKSVVGQGSATKLQVAFMIQNILSLTQQLPPDESDAAATAICHINTTNT